MNFRTISQLPQTTTLGSEDLVEVSKALAKENEDSPQRYQSYRITLDSLGNHIRDLALNQLSSNETDFGRNHNQMWKWLQKIVNNIDVDSGSDVPLDLSGNVEFYGNPKINGEIDDFGETSDELAVNVNTMRNFMASNSPMLIKTGSEFITRYFNVENNLTLESTTAPSFTGDKHNEYLFRISKTVSDIWEAPASGIFTCYGWVDEETEGEPDNARRWVALEGKVTEGDDTDPNCWKILQLQPFNHNLFCSYVGFTFPVSKGMKLRVRTGFRVGTNSNKYQSVQGSLTNHIANAFVGGIYHTIDMRENFSSESRNIDLQQLEHVETSTTKALKAKINEIIDVLNSR